MSADLSTNKLAESLDKLARHMDEHEYATQLHKALDGWIIGSDHVAHLRTAIKSWAAKGPEVDPHQMGEFKVLLQEFLREVEKEATLGVTKYYIEKVLENL